MSQKTNGKMSKKQFDITFEDLFELQRENQSMMLNRGMYDIALLKGEELPLDIPDLCSYHIQQLVSEIGEVLSADKRWKNFRNEYYDKEAKKEEIADCFIVLMNIAMYSGIDGNEMVNKIFDKMLIVQDRISEEN
jgi:NTP pyrophosphatase (non-canonical NTP hydrolase)